MPIASAVPMLTQILDRMPQGLMIAVVATFVLRVIVAALQHAAATLVALFAKDETRAERALQVLDSLHSSRTRRWARRGARSRT